MTVFENVCNAMFWWDPRWASGRQFFEILQNVHGDDEMKAAICQINNLLNGVGGIPGGIGDDGQASGLSHQDFLNIYLASHFFSSVVSSNRVSDEVLQEIANADPKDILAVLNRHQAIFLPQVPPTNFGTFDRETLYLLQAKATQTLIERKIVAVDADHLNDLNELADANNEKAICDAIFKDGPYGSLQAASSNRATLLATGIPAILKAQAKTMQALLKNPRFSAEKRAQVMKVAGTLIRNLKGLKFFVEADYPPTQIDFSKLMPSEWVLAAITSPEKAKAAIVLLNQFPPSASNLDEVIINLLNAVDSLEKAEILRVSIWQLFSGSSNDTRKEELLTHFTQLPPDQRCKEVAQGLSMMSDNEPKKIKAISDVVRGLKDKGKEVRKKDLQDAIDHLSKVPPGDELNQYDCVLQRFCDLHENIRSVPVAIAMEKCVQAGNKEEYVIEVVNCLALNKVLEENGLADEIVDALYEAIGGNDVCFRIHAEVEWDGLTNFVEEKIGFIVKCFGQIPDEKRTLDVIKLLIKYNPDFDEVNPDDKPGLTRYCQMIVGLLTKGNVANLDQINDDFYKAISECPDEEEARQIGEAMSVLLSDEALKNRVFNHWRRIEWGNATGAVAEALVRYKNDDAAADKRVETFIPNDFDRRAVVVKLANAGFNTKGVLSETVIDVIAKISSDDDRNAMIELLAGVPDEKAIQQAAIVLKEAKEPNSGVLKKIIEAQKIKFEVVLSENQPEELRKSIRNMTRDYQVCVVCQIPDQAEHRILPVNSRLPDKAKVCGLEAKLHDEGETLIRESFATKKDEKHRVEVYPQSIIKEGLFTLRTVEELAMYAKKRGMSIELAEMDPENKVKVKVLLGDEEKEIPFKALFFLAAAAQGISMKEKGNIIFEPVKESAVDAKERVRDQKNNYLKSLEDIENLSAEQKKELQDELFHDEAPSIGRGMSPSRSPG